MADFVYSAYVLSVTSVCRGFAAMEGEVRRVFTSVPSSGTELSRMQMIIAALA